MKEFRGSFDGYWNKFTIITVILNVVIFLKSNFEIKIIPYIIGFDIFFVLTQLFIRRVMGVRISENEILIEYRDLLNISTVKSVNINELNFSLKIESTVESSTALTFKCKKGDKLIFKIISGEDGWEDNQLSELFELLNTPVEPNLSK